MRVRRRLGATARCAAAGAGGCRSAAFDRYLSESTYTANQIHFINLIVEHLTANGAMEVARLYESPFTDHAPHGPDMIFTDDQVDGIVAILDDVRHRALPVVTVA